MKRVTSLVLAFVMCFAFCISSNAATQVPSTAKAVFTLSSHSCNMGDTVTIRISLKSSEDINSIALSDFTYDESAL